MSAVFSGLGGIALGISIGCAVLSVAGKGTPDAERGVASLSAQWAIAAALFFLVAK